jgi:hypothetical protein
VYAHPPCRGRKKKKRNTAEDRFCIRHGAEKKSSRFFYSVPCCWDGNYAWKEGAQEWLCLFLSGRINRRAKHESGLPSVQGGGSGARQARGGVFDSVPFVLRKFVWLI